MPRYTDPQTGRTIRSETPLSDADLEEAFGGGPPGEPADSGGFLGGLKRAGSYLAERGKEFGGALGRLSQLMPDEEPSTFGEKLGRFGARAADVATISGPLLAPGLTGGGALVGATVRGAGGTEDTARAADLATNLVGGGLQAARGAYRGLRSARDVIEEGTALGARVPGMRQAAAGARRGLFDPIIDRAEALNLRLDPGATGRLEQGLTDALADPMVKPAERRIIQPLLDRIQQGGTLGAGGGMSAREIDDALATISANAPKAFGARRALNAAFSDLTTGSPVEGALSHAQREYYRFIKPGQHIANQIGNAKTPGAMAQAALRGWDNIAAETKAMLDPTGEIGGLVDTIRQSQHGGMIGSTAIGFGLYGAGRRAYQKFKEGDMLGGFTALAGAGVVGLGLRYPGAAQATVTGALPGIVRGAAAAASNPAARDLIRGRAETPPGTPAEPERQGESPPVQQAPREAPRAPQAAGDAIDRVAALVRLPPEVLRIIITKESSGNVNALSHPAPDQVQTPAHGIMQITPGTFETIRPQVEHLLGRPAALGNPLDNLLGGALLWRKYLDQTGGDLGAAASLYHGGENTAYHGPRTRQYAADILNRLEAR